VVAAANAVQAATVGAAFSYDATQGGATFRDAGGGGLTYAVTVEPAGRGLSATGGRISGTPTAPGVFTATVTAVDRRGQAVSDRFAIVGFAAGLATPATGEGFRYADGTTGITPPPGGPGVPGGNLGALDNTPATNRITDAGAALGRVLFHDPRLSATDQLSCASCHLQAVGFADTARFSRGVRGGRTGRHSMPLANARYWARGTFFWDERARTLEQQVLLPIQDTVEMALPLDQLETKLRATAFYGPLFQAAFGTPAITRERVSQALAQFVRALSSFSSPFDQAFVGGAPDFTRLGVAAARGQQLFTGRAGCARCHTSVAQVSDDVHNTGLDATVTDVGAGAGRFKAPSLRNVGVRTRFMHDGRFTTLEQVVAFYDVGVQPNPGLDPRLRGPGGQPQRLGLSPRDRADLVEFLHALTDSTFLRDRRFGDPFAPR
jgi:cytochrome c peroxidase